MFDREPKLEGKENASSSSDVDFSKPPVRIDKYNIGDRLTRENFISLVILSFAVSRGDAEIQNVFFEWLKYKYELDYTGVHTFLELKGSSLSDAERKKFQDAYDRVKSHREKNGKNLLIDVNLTTMNIEAMFFSSHHSVRQFFDFENINTLSDFNTCVDDYFSKNFPDKLKKKEERKFSSFS